MSDKGKTVALICPSHGFVRGGVCPECAARREAEFGVGTDSWVEGWWDDLGPEPVYIHNRKHLIEECSKRGLAPRVLLKPKSQGRGLEMMTHGLNG